MENQFPGGAAAVGRVRRMVVPSGACGGMTVGEVCESLDDPWTILNRIKGEEFKLVRDYGKLLKATSVLVTELKSAGDGGRSSAAPKLPEGGLGSTASLPQAVRKARDAGGIILKGGASQQVEPTLAVVQLMPVQSPLQSTQLVPRTTAGEQPPVEPVFVRPLSFSTRELPWKPIQLMYLLEWLLHFLDLRLVVPLWAIRALRVAAKMFLAFAVVMCVRHPWLALQAFWESGGILCSFTVDPAAHALKEHLQAQNVPTQPNQPETFHTQSIFLTILILIASRWATLPPPPRPAA